MSASHTIPIPQGILMGVVWEQYGNGFTTTKSHRECGISAGMSMILLSFNFLQDFWQKDSKTYPLLGCPAGTGCNGLFHPLVPIINKNG